MLLHNERKKLSSLFMEWAQKSMVPFCPIDVINYLTINGLLNENKARKILKKDKKDVEG